MLNFIKDECYIILWEATGIPEERINLMAAYYIVSPIGLACRG
jgi:hypothetical protein